MSYVYLIRAGTSDLYKVGYTSKSPEERRASLQTGNPYPLEVVTSWSGTPDDEKRLHAILREFRREGEWFELTVASLLGLLARYEVLSSKPKPKVEVLSDSELNDRIKKDIQEAYFEYGPFQEDGGTIRVSEGYQTLLRIGALTSQIWSWYDEDILCKELPFDRYERYVGTTYFDYCVEHGYIQKNADNHYRVNPELSAEGYEFFLELFEESF